MSMNKWTQKDYEWFKKRCAFWQSKLSLMEWKLYYKIEKRDCNYIAQVEFDYEGRVATISLNENRKIKPKDAEITIEDLDKSAFHEIMELVLVDMYAMARYVFSENHVSEIQHIVIRRMENTVYYAMKDMK